MSLALFGIFAVPALGEVYWQDDQSGYNNIVNYNTHGVVGDKIGGKQYYVIPLNSLNSYGQNYNYNYNPYSGYNYYNQNNRYSRNTYGRSTPTQWGILDNSIIGTRTNSLPQSKGYYTPPPTWYKPYVYDAPKTAKDYAGNNNQQNRYRNDQQGQNELKQKQMKWEKYLITGDMRDYPFPLTMDEIERIQREGEAREK